jgi:hypothetical protein
VRSRERDGCLGGKLDLVRTFHGMYRWFGIVPQGGFLVSFVVIFGDLCRGCPGGNPANPEVSLQSVE